MGNLWGVDRLREVYSISWVDDSAPCRSSSLIPLSIDIELFKDLVNHADFLHVLADFSGTAS